MIALVRLGTASRTATATRQDTRVMLEEDRGMFCPRRGQSPHFKPHILLIQIWSVAGKMSQNGTHLCAGFACDIWRHDSPRIKPFRGISLIFCGTASGRFTMFPGDRVGPSTRNWDGKSIPNGITGTCHLSLVGSRRRGVPSLWSGPGQSVS